MDLMPLVSDLPTTLVLAVDAFQDRATGARKGPFASFDLDAAGWRGDLDRVFTPAEVAEQLGQDGIDTSGIAGGILAVQFSTSYFDPSMGSQLAMTILQSARAEALAGLPGVTPPPSSSRTSR